MTAPAEVRAAIVRRLNSDEWMERHFGISCHAGDVADAVLEVLDLPGRGAALVESIAAGFDTRALQARINGALTPAGRDIDAVLAWECAARWIREHAAGRPTVVAAAVSSPTRTPGNPGPVDVSYGPTSAPGVSPECQQSAAEVHEACDGCLCPCHPCAACGCDSRWHDTASGRCTGDFMACRCPAYASATSPTGDTTDA